MNARILAPLALTAGIALAGAQKLVILHTNDTHSQIEPTPTGQGGILQRKAIIDSVRNAEKNVILVDAGDAVQGSLYFKLFRGDADYPLMELSGYDIRILGNHEFDNGLEELAKYWKHVGAERLSSNYDFSETPARGIFKPWAIRKIGSKKIGFLGVNVDPESLIIASNYRGMRFSPAIQTADSIASLLKRKGCDMVVAVTHIGYDVPGKEDDLLLASRSRNIDVVIGGHSHTLVDPEHPEKTPSVVKNADGRPVLVVQTGKSGKYIGEISIDLANIGSTLPQYRLIPVTDRFPESKIDAGMRKRLAPFKAVVDSICALPVGNVAEDMDGNARVGAFPNWVADFASWYGKLKLDSLRNCNPSVPALDMSIMNVGGIRSSWQKGVLDKGTLLSTFPFSNRFVIMRLSGADLLRVIDRAARKGGEAISREALAIVGENNGGLKHLVVNGEKVDPERDYVVATIDYLAWGNDGLRELANGETFYVDEVEIAAPLLRYLDYLSGLGIPISGDPRSRFITSD